jgi:hypothetical protein
VPVDWVDDPDSRVEIVATALADLRGVVRLAFATPGVRFVGVGVASTGAYALLLLMLIVPLGSAAAPHLLELGVLIVDRLGATVTRYAAPRGWVFRRRRRTPGGRGSLRSFQSVARRR